MERAITFLFFFWLFVFCSYAQVSPTNSNATTTDELGLLSFKSMLSAGSSEDPLSSWNTSSPYCSWPGVVCGRRHPTRVVRLRMNSFNLSGHISPFLSNLSFLRELDLGNNHLTGQIPPELGHLARLRVLKLTANFLHGSIPVDLGGCSNLTRLDLSSNLLQGEIPTEIGASLKNLINLNLSYNILSGQIPGSLAELPSIEFLSLLSNNLSGEIPSSLGNLSTLSFLNFGGNTLTGAIPSSIGMLTRLHVLSLGFNNLSGAIPTSIWNISTLRGISFQYNMLTGEIPPNAFNNLPHLQNIMMDANNFEGHIPASIANSSNLLRIQLNYNHFSGIVPPEVGRLGNLYWLQLAANFLQAKEPRDWEFITALTNCSKLQLLGLGRNKFEGVLPDSLSNLSTSLVNLMLSSNKISGAIPVDIGNLFNLDSLFLNNNSFTGTLPSSLYQLKKLGKLTAHYNRLSGEIPRSIGNLTELVLLQLGKNSFNGRLPSALGNLRQLSLLDLSSNNFTGLIPRGIFNITTLSMILDLSHNNLEGSITQEIGNLKNLVVFHAESNKLSGEIPATLGGCQLLQRLSLQNNILKGSIPSVMGQLKGLETLDLSSNNLSGQIPKILGGLTMLQNLNLSFNGFAGEVPNVGIFSNSTKISIQGNSKLCGGVLDLHLPPCSLHLAKKKHRSPLVPLLASLIGALLVLALLYKIFTWHKKGKAKIPTANSMQGHPLISYLQLVKATDSFSTTNFLGSGSFGSVYKGDLDGHDGESGNLVAVKVLKLETPKAHKSFIAECEALRNMRHRNLVKIITVCSSIDAIGNDFKAMVYDFMPNGSLESWLHPHTNNQAQEKHLNLRERVSILLDVAYALDYLHCHGPAPTVHCDVKSSNVLLDSDMVAHVGDFGLARILVDGSSILQQPTSSSMRFRGTIGYAAPEYGVGNMVSTNGDIYSYGILVLETVTGKKPTGSEFRQALCLREYVELGLPERVNDIVDVRLSPDLESGRETASGGYQRKMDCLASLLTIGMACSQELPSSRMQTKDIIKILSSIRKSLTPEPRM